MTRYSNSLRVGWKRPLDEILGGRRDARECRLKTYIALLQCREKNSNNQRSPKISNTLVYFIPVVCKCALLLHPLRTYVCLQLVASYALEALIWSRTSSFPEWRMVRTEPVSRLSESRMENDVFLFFKVHFNGGERYIARYIITLAVGTEV